jgi:anti-anti-sigma factor
MRTLLSPNEAVIALSGDLDISRTSELARLEKTLEEPESVVFDLSNVDYVDTTFLRFLMAVKRHANKTQSTAIKIVGTNPRVRRVFEVTGLTRTFNIDKPLSP